MTDVPAPVVARLCLALAEEMHAMRALIEALATELISEPMVLEAFGTELQTFDLLAQRACESAGLLTRIAEGKGALEAVAEVRLERMQQRLRDALKAA